MSENKKPATLNKEAREAFETLEWELNNMKRLVMSGERGLAYAMSLIRDVANKQFNIAYDREFGKKDVKSF